ncbi:unnamed protein product, partial [Hapterophycus canaliculatus]
QDIGWFDEHPAGEMPSAVTSAMAKIQDGIGRKVCVVHVDTRVASSTLARRFGPDPDLVWNPLM